jgi:hypothetical protein
MKGRVIESTHYRFVASVTVFERFLDFEQYMSVLAWLSNAVNEHKVHSRTFRKAVERGGMKQDLHLEYIATGIKRKTVVLTVACINANDHNIAA